MQDSYVRKVNRPGAIFLLLTDGMGLSLFTFTPWAPEKEM